MESTRSYVYGTRKVFHGRYTVSKVAPCKHLTGVIKFTSVSMPKKDMLFFVYETERTFIRLFSCLK